MKSAKPYFSLHPGRWLRGQSWASSRLQACAARLAAIIGALWTRGWRAQQGTAAIEFAIIVVPFCMMIIFIFALGLHFFYQELLDSALNVAVRQVQTGNAQNVANGSGFVTSYLCPDSGNMLTCSNLYVNVKKITFSGTQDFYNYTSGTLPSSNGTLSLANYSSASFCNAGTSEFILVTAIYLAPSFTGTFLPNVFSLTYNGSQVDAIMSQVATYTENYTVQTASGAAASC